ncbi:hypothetical protein [Methylomonas sp. AM2-LC]|uniref:hypothetical protein n=1 Tax=Methylomonas sp. AM2-LC TaxID=3153301 RepID=UPI003263A363
MNRLEHLLFILSEECSEVAQRASKAARFSMDEVQPGQDLTNEERIFEEMNDVLAIYEMIVTERQGKCGLSRTKIEAKKQKVERFLNYSNKACGTLNDPIIYPIDNS